MKKLTAILAAAALVTMAGTAFAADVTVTADIPKVCTAATVSNNIVFPAIDPTSGTQVKASDSGGTQGVIALRCTAGTAYTVAATSTPALTGSNGGTLAYTIGALAGGTSASAALQMTTTIDATIAAAAINTAVVGTYTGTAVITVSY